MVNVRLLKAKLVENGFTNAKMAKKLDMTEKTFSTRLKNGVFKTNEIDIFKEELNLSEWDCVKIFFAEKVS